MCVYTQRLKKAPDIYWQQDLKTLAQLTHQENDLFNARKKYQNIEVKMLKY